MPEPERGKWMARCFTWLAEDRKYCLNVERRVVFTVMRICVHVCMKWIYDYRILYVTRSTSVLLSRSVSWNITCHLALHWKYHISWRLQVLCDSSGSVQQREAFDKACKPLHVIMSFVTWSMQICIYSTVSMSQWQKAKLYTISTIHMLAVH